MSSLSTIPKGDSAWLLRKSIQRIIQQVSVLETNIGSSTTGNSANTQIIFNDNGVLRGDSDLIFNTALNKLVVNNIEVSTNATITGDLTVDTSTLKVDSANDRVGIGIDTPAWPLDIRSATAVAQILSTTGTNEAYLQFSNTGGIFYLGRENSAGTSFASPAYSAVLYAGGAYPLVTTVNGSERYRIASDGVATWSNVGGVAGTAMTLNATGLGIGMGPANNLSIGSATYASFGVKIDSITQSSLIFKGTPDAAGYEHAKIVSGRESSPFTYGSFLAFYTEGKNSGTTDTSVERARFNSTGNLAFANGLGIDFSAVTGGTGTATGNVLNDYEEGTWTATLKGSVSNPTTPVTATGRYTKIGRQVSIQLFVNNVTTTGASGRIQIDGLPFANNGPVEAISNVGFYNMATFTGVPFGLTSASSTVVDMWSSVSAGVFQAVNYNPGSGQAVWVNLTYTV